MNRKLSIILMFVTLFCAGISEAQVVITNALVKAPIPGQAISAGYLLLKNEGDTPRVLVGVSSASAEKIEMHTHVHNHETGMMSMKKLDSVEIAENGSLEFVQGRHHLMVFSLAKDAVESGSVELKFEFENGESVTMDASIESWR